VGEQLSYYIEHLQRWFAASRPIGFNVIASVLLAVRPDECKVAVHTAFFLVRWLGRKRGICTLLSVAPLVGSLPQSGIFLKQTLGER